jgi:hypothetical protein
LGKYGFPHILQKVNFYRCLKGLNLRKIALVLLPLLLLSGCAPAASKAEVVGCDGVEVRVNFGILDQEKISSCVSFEGEQILALEALHEAGVGVEGTLTYPEAIVCRVNGLPAAEVAIEVDGEEPHLETCEDMPPAFAYWALWVINDPEIGWEYAMEGASSLQLKRGQSIGLAFASGDQAPNPDNQ